MQTVSFAGSTYNIPNTRGDRPWSGLSDFVIAAASKCINTGGGNFTLLANINFGATFGLVSAFYTSRTASAADAGQLRLANTDTIKWRNGLGSANLSLAIATNRLTFEGSRLIIAGAAEIVNADVSASAAIAYSKLNLATSIVNADVAAAAAIAVSKLAALTASRAVVSDGSGFLAAATTTATEIGYVNGVTSAIQTQLNAKGTVTSVSGTANQISVATGTTTPVLSLPSPLTTPGAVTVTGNLAFTPTTAGIVGTPTNNNTAAGNVGEYVESIVSATNFPTSTNHGDLTSISLTAGDWDVTAIMFDSRNGATVTAVEAGISVTSGNSGTGLVQGSNNLRGSPPTATNDDNIAIPNYRMSLSATTTVYFKYTATFTVGTPQASGRLSARRQR